ncbi:MAG: alpha/beta hydrolase [Myxococcota bacterium]
MRRALRIIGVALLVVLVALPWLMDREEISLDETRRQSLREQGHSFAPLAAGHVHYELAGPARGPLVVLIHGVSGPMEVWDAALPPLHAAGFRTLRFDHYGRGWSDRLDVDYDLDLYVSTVEQLLAHLHEDQPPVALMGSSMGAIVSAEYALGHPQAVRALVLLGPAGFPLEASPLARAIAVPGLGDYLMAVAGDRSLAAHNQRYFHDPTPFAAFQARFEEQLRVVGSKAAVLSTMRHTPVQAYVDRYAELGALDRPILIVWGRQDAAFPYAHHTEAQAAMPSAELLTVEEAGHLPMLEQPGSVMPRVIEFLGQSST